MSTRSNSTSNRYAARERRQFQLLLTHIFALAQLYTQTDLHPDFLEKDKEFVESRRSPVTHRNVPTTRFTKAIKFTNEDSRWMKKLRQQAATFSWQKELVSAEEGLSPRVEEELWKYE